MNAVLRLAAAVAVTAAGITSAGALEERHEHPHYSGQMRLDWCFTYGKDCGQMSANDFCRVQGYEHATNFEVEKVSPTKTPTGEVCNGSFCTGFAFIDCFTSGERGRARDWPQRIDPNN